LHERGILGHLALEDADGAVDGVDGIDEFFLGRQEVCFFFFPDDGRVL